MMLGYLHRSAKAARGRGRFNFLPLLSMFEAPFRVLLMLPNVGTKQLLLGTYDGQSMERRIACNFGYPESLTICDAERVASAAVLRLVSESLKFDKEKVL
jgi:hypothetical protein